MTNLINLISIGAFLLSLLTTVMVAWNAYQNRGVSLMLAELRLNIMKEMNGRYERADDAVDLKRRVERLEAAKMKI